MANTSVVKNTSNTSYRVSVYQFFPAYTYPYTPGYANYFLGEILFFKMRKKKILWKTDMQSGIRKWQSVFYCLSKSKLEIETLRFLTKICVSSFQFRVFDFDFSNFVQKFKKTAS